MGKTRDLFKKIGDIKGTFHVRLGTADDGNSKDLTVAEEIKKRAKEYTEELYKKGLNDPDKNDSVVTHLVPTSWSVKSSGPKEVLLSTKLVEMMGFQLSYLKS